MAAENDTPFCSRFLHLIACHRQRPLQVRCGKYHASAALRRHQQPPDY